MSAYDIVIVGAGAAGIGAALELNNSGASFIVLEAADRVGGRAYTDKATLQIPWDQGCHWLHSGDVNPLVQWADQLGASYAKEERIDHFTIWQDGQFVSKEELAEIGESAA